MRTSLTSAQIEQYGRNGFLAIPSFLSEAELETWRNLTDEGVRARLALDDELSNQSAADAYYANVFTQASGLRRLDARMARLVLDPELGEMAARLAGVDAIRLWNEQALYKQPFGNPTAWHLDAPYWSFENRQALTIWVALDAATLENGCLWYLPGTHLEARFDAIELGSDQQGIFEPYPEWRSIESVPVELPAGGAVWHNALLAHGAGANMTRHGRRALTIAYMPDGVVYNGRRDEFVYSEQEAARMLPGDPLVSEEANPLVWTAADAREETTTVSRSTNCRSSQANPG